MLAGCWLRIEYFLFGNAFQIRGMRRQRQTKKTGGHGDAMLGRKAQRIEWRGKKLTDELTRDPGFQ